MITEYKKKHTLMISNTAIITLRLLLKKESLYDFERFFAMSKNPEVMKFIGDGSIYHWTKKVALEKFRTKLDFQDDSNPGVRAVYTKKDSFYIGWCAIRYSKFLDHIELGYSYCTDAWRNGYATEAASALLSETYGIKEIDRIRACTHPDNIASIRVLEKLGFSLTGSKHSLASGRDIPVFQIDRKTFWQTIKNSRMATKGIQQY
jgi:ribosomal-protein-alanine N-acetyltransferase